MPLFAVLTDKPNAELGEKIGQLYPRDFHKLSDTQWLVSADTIPRAMSEELGVREGKYGRVMVIQTTGAAAGWHNRSAWDWINQKASKSNG